MKSLHQTMATIAAAALGLWTVRAEASVLVTQTFDGGGTAYTLQNGADNLNVGAPHNNTGRLTDGGGGELRQIIFNQVPDPGNVYRVTADFDFLINRQGGGGADGIGFALLNTATYGTSGGAPAANFGEEPSLTGTLGFEFDTFNNGAPDPNNHYLAVHFGTSGTDVAQNAGVPDFADNAWHTAHIVIDLGASTVNTFQIDGTPYFTNLNVPGLAPYQMRLAFGGRTGGATETALIDNIRGQLFTVPEPSTLLLLGTGLAGLVAVRQRIKK